MACAAFFLTEFGVKEANISLHMLVFLHPDNPQQRIIKQIVEVLNHGGIIIYPTDTIYGLGCSIYQRKAIDAICRVKQVDPAKANLSFVCSSLSDLSKYASQIDTPTYRLLKQNLPGPYTFILPASREVPKILQSRKATIGLRIPQNNIAMALVEALGHPILSATLPGDMVEDYTDPATMQQNFGHLADFVIDGGPGGFEPSTVVDLTGPEPVVTREGKGFDELIL
jgi:tRNA threonylcarbamoyl adenosine modification protein (Sua5/YciO/YrdC/YwlC family)